jgi:hypothetical protein
VFKEQCIKGDIHTSFGSAHHGTKNKHRAANGSCIEISIVVCMQAYVYTLNVKQLPVAASASAIVNENSD